MKYDVFHMLLFLRSAQSSQKDFFLELKNMKAEDVFTRYKELSVQNPYNSQNQQMRRIEHIEKPL